MGYHDDTCAAIILHVCQEKKCDDQAIPHIEKEVCIFLLLYPPQTKFGGRYIGITLSIRPSMYLVNTTPP